MDEERKFDVCPCCKEKKYLNSVTGIYKGKLWAGWLCASCLHEIQKKNHDKEIQEASLNEQMYI